MTGVARTIIMYPLPITLLSFGAGGRFFWLDAGQPLPSMITDLNAANNYFPPQLNVHAVESAAC